MSIAEPVGPDFLGEHPTFDGLDRKLGLVEHDSQELGYPGQTPQDDAGLNAGPPLVAVRSERSIA